MAELSNESAPAASVPSPPAQPAREPAVPPPPIAAPDPTERTHDSFYLRMGLGPAYGKVTAKLENMGQEFKGGGFGWDLMLGGTVANAVAVGGGLVSMQINDPEYTLTSGTITVCFCVAAAPQMPWFSSMRVCGDGLPRNGPSTRSLPSIM